MSCTAAVVGRVGSADDGERGIADLDGSLNVSVAILGRRNDLLAGCTAASKCEREPLEIFDLLRPRHRTSGSGEKRSFPPSNRMGLLAPDRLEELAFFLTVPEASSVSSLDSVS